MNLQSPRKHFRNREMMLIWYLLLAHILHPADSLKHSDGKPDPCSDCEQEEDNYLLKGIGIGVGAVVGVAAVPVVLPALGFTAGGVAAGSVAAGVQSAVYGGAATGVFAGLQSVGAAGLGAAGTTLSGTVGAAVGASVSKLVEDSWKDNENNEE